MSDARWAPVFNRLREQFQSSGNGQQTSVTSDLWSRSNGIKALWVMGMVVALLPLAMGARSSGDDCTLSHMLNCSCLDFFDSALNNDPLHQSYGEACLEHLKRDGGCVCWEFYMDALLQMIMPPQMWFRGMPWL